MSASPRRVIGVDGGGTRTRFLLADETGASLGEGSGGSGLLGAGEDAEVAGRIVERVRALARESGVPLPVDAFCAGLAGVSGRPEARELLEHRIREAAVAKRVRVVSDSETAFRDAFGSREGILLIAGTGSVGVGRARGGPLRRVGGWGALLSDEGSGYRLGLRGIRASIRSTEGRNPPTTLTRRLFTALGAESPRAVFEWSERATKSDVAALAPDVLEEAEGGDRAAGEIVGRAVEGLVEYARALAEGLELGSAPPVALVGGLVEPGGGMRPPVETALMAAGFRVRPEKVSPARGAAKMALEI